VFLTVVNLLLFRELNLKVEVNNKINFLFFTFYRKVDSFHSDFPKNQQQRPP